MRELNSAVLGDRCERASVEGVLDRLRRIGRSYLLLNGHRVWPDLGRRRDNRMPYADPATQHRDDGRLGQARVLLSELGAGHLIHAQDCTRLYNGVQP
jgi:hypothetical protein